MGNRGSWPSGSSSWPRGRRIRPNSSQARQALAITSLGLGYPAAAREHTEQGVALYDSKRDRSHTYLYGLDSAVALKAFGAVALWLLGYPDQAAQRSREALALGHELLQPSSQALALHFAAMLHQLRGEPRVVLACADLAIAISTAHSFLFWHANGTMMRGWALSECGSTPEGVAVLRQGLEAWLATGSLTYQTYYRALLPVTLGREGRTQEGLKVLDDALALVERTGECFCHAELHRLQGALLMQEAGADGLTHAEACFRKAIAVAAGQNAKSLELRAAMSLTRLHQKRGRQAEARPILAECYDWFTEGFDTPDLQEAKALLEQLA